MDGLKSPFCLRQFSNCKKKANLEKKIEVIDANFEAVALRLLDAELLHLRCNVDQSMIDVPGN